MECWMMMPFIETLQQRGHHQCTYNISQIYTTTPHQPMIEKGSRANFPGALAPRLTGWW